MTRAFRFRVTPGLRTASADRSSPRSGPSLAGLLRNRTSRRKVSAQILQCSRGQEASAGWKVTPASVETTSPLAVAAQIDGLTSGPLTAAAAWTVDRQP
jgi:hypothetical protein